MLSNLLDRGDHSTKEMLDSTYTIALARVDTIVKLHSNPTLLPKSYLPITPAQGTVAMENYIFL